MSGQPNLDDWEKANDLARTLRKRADARVTSSATKELRDAAELLELLADEVRRLRGGV